MVPSILSLFELCICHAAPAVRYVRSYLKVRLWSDTVVIVNNDALHDRKRAGQNITESSKNDGGVRPPLCNVDALRAIRPFTY